MSNVGVAARQSARSGAMAGQAARPRVRPERHWRSRTRRAFQRAASLRADGGGHCASCATAPRRRVPPGTPPGSRRVRGQRPGRRRVRGCGPYATGVPAGVEPFSGRLACPQAVEATARPAPQRRGGVSHPGRRPAEDTERPPGHGSPAREDRRRQPVGAEPADYAGITAQRLPHLADVFDGGFLRKAVARGVLARGPAVLMPFVGIRQERQGMESLGMERPGVVTGSVAGVWSAAGAQASRPRKASTPA